MTTRAKFEVTKVSETAYSGKRQEIQRLVPKTAASESERYDSYESTGIPIREITLDHVYDNGIDQENASFAKATPSGTITFTVNNPALAEEFKAGQSYYVDFTPVA
jgi:hypothetical protein